MSANTTTTSLTAPVQAVEDMAALAHAICDALNSAPHGDPRDGWIVETTNPHLPAAILDGPHPTDPDTRVRVSARVETWRKDGGRTLTLVGVYCHTGSQPWRGGPSGEQRTDKINVSIKRGPHAIAADMRRRLLPGVEGITSDMEAQTVARDVARQQRLETIDRLARAGRDAFTLTVPHGGDPGEQSRRWISGPASGGTRSGYVKGELDVSGGRLSLDGLSIAQMETLLMAFALVAHD